MEELKDRFREKAEELRAKVRALVRQYREEAIDTVRLWQLYGGARGVKCLVWETSALDPYEGIRFRGYSIPELKERLPHFEGDDQPLPEALFWLLLVDEIPTREQVRQLSVELVKRSEMPKYVYEVINALPRQTHPMAQFSIAIASMKGESVFDARYREGLSKSEYWEAVYEDVLNLIARLPRIAAYIYRRSFKDGVIVDPDPSLDWAGNFARMLGVADPQFTSFLRLYLTIHADHEGGNASAHTTHLVGSTLSDPYLTFAAGMNALAGPLHGAATQEVIRWILEMNEYLGTEQPSVEQIESYVQKTLSEGRVIPGYGHAVLRRPDPRFIAQKAFAEVYLKDDPLVQTVWKIFEVVPPILQGLGKVKNPWPNVDAHSGAILYHYGLREFSFYTVMFGVSRALGTMASLCWSRALGLPLERPKSVTTQWVKQFLIENQS